MAAHILIAGGGIAAVETIAALRALAGTEPRITVITPRAQVDRRASSVTAPFGQAPTPIDLQEVAQHAPFDIQLGTLASVEPERHEAVTSAGERVTYDKLVITTGAIPWLPFPGATTFSGTADAAAVAEVLEAARQPVFVCASASDWSLPIYELALMAALKYPASSVAVVTAEPAPLWVFGLEAIDAIRELLTERGVALLSGVRPLGLEDGKLALADSEPIDADAAVTLPTYWGPRINGLPHDVSGFLVVDTFGAVDGVEDVYAAGDATAFPLKQGGLAAQQADAVAESIAAWLGADVKPEPFQPVLRGLLLTGHEPLYLRSDGRRGLSRRLNHVAVSGDALWWPPAKVAGRYLAPAMAQAGTPVLYEQPLRELEEQLGDIIPEQEDASELALVLAQEDASRGDYARALHALETARALSGGELPPVWERSGTLWRARAAWS